MLKMGTFRLLGPGVVGGVCGQRHKHTQWQSCLALHHITILIFFFQLSIYLCNNTCEALLCCCVFASYASAVIAFVLISHLFSSPKCMRRCQVQGGVVTWGRTCDPDVTVEPRPGHDAICPRLDKRWRSSTAAARLRKKNSVNPPILSNQLFISSPHLQLFIFHKWANIILQLGSGFLTFQLPQTERTANECSRATPIRTQARTRANILPQTLIRSFVFNDCAVSHAWLTAATALFVQHFLMKDFHVLFIK